LRSKLASSSTQSSHIPPKSSKPKLTPGQNAINFYNCTIHNYAINMPASVASAPVNRTVQKTPASRARKPAAKAGAGPKNAAVNGVQNGAHPGAYAIMASRIANRVAEMAENMTFVEREK
jgi:hypothetical protein